MKMGMAYPVNIPIQVFYETDILGKVTPFLFKFRCEDQSVERVPVLEILARSDRNYAGVREKQFVCSTQMGDRKRAVELRMNVDDQRWRIYQFLS